MRKASSPSLAIWALSQVHDGPVVSIDRNYPEQVNVGFFANRIGCFVKHKFRMEDRVLSDRFGKALYEGYFVLTS